MVHCIVHYIVHYMVHYIVHYILPMLGQFVDVVTKAATLLY